MILDLDIYRSAQVLVKRHGPDAPIHAATRPWRAAWPGVPCIQEWQLAV